MNETPKCQIKLSSYTARLFVTDYYSKILLKKAVVSKPYRLTGRHGSFLYHSALQAHREARIISVSLGPTGSQGGTDHFCITRPYRLTGRHGSFLYHSALQAHREARILSQGGNDHSAREQLTVQDHLLANMPMSKQNPKRITLNLTSYAIHAVQY